MDYTVDGLHVLYEIQQFRKCADQKIPNILTRPATSSPGLGARQVPGTRWPRLLAMDRFRIWFHACDLRPKHAAYTLQSSHVIGEMDCAGFVTEKGGGNPWG